MYQEVIIACPSHLGFGRVEIGKEGSLLTDVDRAMES
jgi:hypothetical protein